MKKYESVSKKKRIVAKALNHETLFYEGKIFNHLWKPAYWHGVFQYNKNNYELDIVESGIIGAPLHFHFEGDQVSLTRLDVVLSLPISQFLHFLSLVDLAFGKIYPLGTIVELDRELLPAELVQRFISEDLDLYALLVGRRVQLDGQTYIDYVGHIYPYGMRLDTLPLYISHLFIKRVIAEGYSDAKDSHYIERDLREAYFKASIYSSIYKETTDED